ncbi:reverse transcriptase/maturase family protein [Nostoc sp. FACHB-110]|uniref:reverse transcriptase/maturase family protein n=1 Tax=Nostoc sp. FACHB-110 TaxID=2692834 RepID=UPI00168830D3|nr:reverse transcriptase/maturase family protein [Nostoc sp. FACHB-110]MBD2440971.1 group II intron reverse transcriptase domain-containing protein [Nostoc sp. FACHB-110]
MAAHLEANEFVFRTDVKGYYASINHDILLNLVRRYVDDSFVLDLVQQYLQRFVSDGGEYTDIEQGISLGCPLSPLMGALYLKPLDDRMAELGCFYVRFMDDWVVLAPTRWKLRAAISAVNQVMNQLEVEQYPDKTFIGRITRGFDFLGYWFTPTGLGVAERTMTRMLDKVSRLYEQGADVERIETYIRRWWLWVKGGVFLDCWGGEVRCVNEVTHPTWAITIVKPNNSNYKFHAFFSVAFLSSSLPSRSGVHTLLLDETLFPKYLIAHSVSVNIFSLFGVKFFRS